MPPIVFSDFKPGIADKPGVNYPPGMATRTNTFRCRCSPTGSLIPGPGHDFDLSGTAFEGSQPLHGYYCAGIYAAGPITPSSGTASAAQRFHELWIATEYDLVTPEKRRRLQRVREFENSPTTDLIYTFDGGAAVDAGIAWACTFGQSRGNKTTPTSPGIPVLAIAWGSNIAAACIMYEFPDDTTPTSNTPKSLGTDAALVVTHQGRFVFRYPTAYGHGTNADWVTTENLKWTPVNNPQGTISVLQAFYPEIADGYSLMGSMSANELFALKETGAVVFIGDLDNPTVYNMPMVVGSGGVPISSGVRTPLGYFYPSRDGIRSWNHGDSSDNVSPMMDNSFYQIGSEPFLAQSYTWATIGELVFLSNNFYFDALTRSYWQLEDPSVMQFRWMTSFRQYIYGARTSYTNADPTLIRGYDIEDGADSYSWQSHPIWQSTERILEFREIELIAEGQGSVTVTMFALDGTPKSEVFQLENNGFVERFRRNFSISGKYLQLRIECDSFETGQAAATVHNVTIHPDARQLLTANA